MNPLNFLDSDEIYSSEDIVFSQQNVSQYRRNIAGGFRPGSYEKVKALVKWANEAHVKLYPFSRGNNWAFGSRLPSEENNYLLDLSLLNEIHDYNSELGYIKVGPGVTQGQVSDFLEEKQSRFFLDVTGSGRETSLIGNSLERGIAYNSLRCQRILNLEVLLGNGDIIHTGFGSRTEKEISHLYPYGVGPQLDPLFFQSNFGIVLSATYQLHPTPPMREAIQIKFHEKDVGKVIAGIKKLLQDGTLDCIVHLADPFRSASTLIPLLPQEHRAYFYQDMMNDGNWSGIASVYGTKKVIKAKLQEVKKELHSVSKVISFNEEKIRKLQKFFQVFGLRRLSEFLKASQGLRGLVRGKATDDALYMAAFNPRSYQNQIRHESDLKVDESERGLLFCVPVAPMTSSASQEMVSLVRTFSKSHSFIDFGITLNTLNEKVVEAVISLHFEKAKSEEAHEALSDLYDQLIGMGFPPYRLNPLIMDKVPHLNEADSVLLRKLKTICDPNGVIAPGRYVLQGRE